jgi:prevent-host-death family protein
MLAEVKIAELKARLSSYLRSVRLGNEIVVKDRETPVARIIPLDNREPGLRTMPPSRTFQEVERLIGAGAGKRIRLKPETLDRAIRDTKLDWLDKWTASKSTSTRR